MIYMQLGRSCLPSSNESGDAGRLSPSLPAPPPMLFPFGVGVAGLARDAAAAAAVEDEEEEPAAME